MERFVKRMQICAKSFEAPAVNLYRQIHKAFILAVCTYLSAGVLCAQSSGSSRFGIEVESGPLWNTRNDVRIPPTGGTPFTLQALTGKGPAGYFRVYATVNPAHKHSLRFLAAPIRLTGAGSFAEPVFFVDETFAPGTETQGVYEFNTYRVTYGYTLLDGDKWRLKIGGSGLIRDAKIELRQQNIVTRDTDLGFVPLAYFQARRELSDRTYLLFDVEGLGAPQGRAIDASLKFHYRLGEKWDVGFGYRTIEGGADVDSVFNFAWLHFGAVSLGYQF